MFQYEVSWPTDDGLIGIQHFFNALCGLPMVVGAISGKHIKNFKSRVGLVNCFYLKNPWVHFELPSHS